LLSAIGDFFLNFFLHIGELSDVGDMRVFFFTTRSANFFFLSGDRRTSSSQALGFVKALGFF
jgi:hypothetical protein